MHAFLTNITPNLHEDFSTLHIYPNPSVGIEEVRQIQQFLSQKPLDSSQQNIVVIHEAHLLTLPAQHAILKTLEEPPGNSRIYLVSPYPDSFLPTILSRVEISSTNPKQQNEVDLNKTSNLLIELQKAEVRERLVMLDGQNFTRESALQFLDSLEHVLHSNLNLPLNYDLLVQTRTYLKSNCNLKLTLDHFALNL